MVLLLNNSIVTDRYCDSAWDAQQMNLAGTMNITAFRNGYVFANRKPDASLSADDRWERNQMKI